MVAAGDEGRVALGDDLAAAELGRVLADDLFGRLVRGLSDDRLQMERRELEGFEVQEQPGDAEMAQ
jgi:hypothetical protein